MTFRRLLSSALVAVALALTGTLASAQMPPQPVTTAPPNKIPNTQTLLTAGDGSTDITTPLATAVSNWNAPCGSYADANANPACQPFIVPAGQFLANSVPTSSLTGNITIGTNTIAMSSSAATAGWAVGDVIAAGGLASGTTITFISSDGMTVTLSNYSTSTGTGRTFVVTTHGIDSVATGETVWGYGNVSQLSKVCIGVNGRRARIHDLALIGSGACGLFLGNGQQNSGAPPGGRADANINGLFIGGKTIGIDAQYANRDVLTNINMVSNTVGLNEGNNVADLALTAMRIASSTGNDMQAYGAQQSKDSNSTLSNAGTGTTPNGQAIGSNELFLYGDNIFATLEDYHNNLTASGAAKRAIPYSAVANNGGFAQFTVASTVNITSITSLGNIMVGGCSSPQTGIAYSCQARGQIQVATTTGGDTCIPRINSVAIGAQVTSGGTDITAYMNAIAASINAAAGTNGGVNAQQLGGRVMLYAPVGTTDNGLVVDCQTTGTATFVTLNYDQFNLAANVPVAQGEVLWIQGTGGHCDGTAIVEFEPSATSFVTSIAPAQTLCAGSTGTVIPQYFLWGGDANLTTGGSVYTTPFAITAVSSDHTTVTTDAAWVSNDGPGTINANGWDIAIQTRNLNARVNDQFFNNGNANDTLLLGGTDIVFNGMRLKHSVCVADMADQNLAPSMVEFNGLPVRGRQDNAYQSVPPACSATGWGLCGLQNAVNSPLAGTEYEECAVPYKAGGLCNYIACSSNGLFAYEDHAEMDANGKVYRFDDKGLTIPQAGGLILATFSSPASGAACTAGQVTVDTGFLYLCTATGAWKRVALTGGY